MPPHRSLFEFDYNRKKTTALTSRHCSRWSWKGESLLSLWLAAPLRASPSRSFGPVRASAAVSRGVLNPLTGLDPPLCTKRQAHIWKKKVQSVSMGQPCQVWILERLAAYLGTLEPCVDTHRTVSYIAWSYRGQERSGGTEALQMFFISGPQGKSVTATPGSFCSQLPGRAEPSADAPPQSGYLTRIVPDAPLAWTVSHRHLYENFRSNLACESSTVDVCWVSMYSLKSVLLFTNAASFNEKRLIYGKY